MAVPVHANRTNPYFDPKDRPIDPSSDLEPSFDLSESDLPADSFSEVPSSQEPQITRPEDIHTPDEIKNSTPRRKPGGLILRGKVCGAMKVFHVNSYELFYSCLAAEFLYYDIVCVFMTFELRPDILFTCI